MKHQIKNRCDGSVIFETDAETIGGAVAAAIAAKSDLSRADLSRADLSRADLSRANLSRADLSRANLSWADLSRANLSRADLSRANLSWADLSRANLSWADLSRANLSRADLSRANLSWADLSRANLSWADLSRANLEESKISKEKLAEILTTRTILPDGDLIGWKNLRGGVICKVKIPTEAKRVGGLIGRKCRAEFVVVLEGEGVSLHDSKTAYKVGETVTPDSYDPNPLVECSNGVHFFITKQEAEDYT